MDPLPNINKAYYIVQQVEKQKQVTSNVHEPSAFFANFNNKGAAHSHKNFKDNKSDKKVCTYCHIEGHEYEQCFERIGYPDWYKGKNNKKGVKMAAQVYTDMNYGMHRDTPFDMT